VRAFGVLGKILHRAGQPNHGPHDQPAQRQIEQQPGYQPNEERQHRDAHGIGAQVGTYPLLPQQQFDFRHGINRTVPYNAHDGVAPMVQHQLQGKHGELDDVGRAQIDAAVGTQGWVAEQRQFRLSWRSKGHQIGIDMGQQLVSQRAGRHGFGQDFERADRQVTVGKPVVQLLLQPAADRRHEQYRFGQQHKHHRQDQRTR